LTATDPGVVPPTGRGSRRAAAVIASGVKQIEYRRSGGTSDWIPTAGAAAAVIVPAASNGEHVFYYRALDNAGHYSETGRFIVRIDSRRPWVRQGNSVSIAQGGVARLRYRLGDNLARTLRVRLEIRRSGAVRARYDLGSRRAGRWLSARLLCSFRPGHYSWRIVATDLAGNVSRGDSKRLLIRRR
jgi:hypothetical protein